MDINSIRSQFPITTKCTYLNHADVGPIPASVQAAMAEQGRLHMEYIGSARNKVQDRYRAGRFLAAQLVEGSADRVSYIQNAASGLSIVINGIDWQEGDNLIIPAKAFPTNFHPWMQLKRRGVEVRLMELHNGCLTPDALKPLIDERTRLVSISQVQFFNGFRVDLASFSEICHAHNALLIVDGTQSIGGMSLDMWASGTDVLIVSAHKWILGPWGIGFMVFSDRAFDTLEVSHVGWKSVRNPYNYNGTPELYADGRRFEPDVENSAGIFGLYARLTDIMETRPREIEARILRLTDRLCEGLRYRDYVVTSARGKKEKSGIVTFVHSNFQTEEIYKRLVDANIIVGLQGMGVQVSPHYYNTEEEIDSLLDVLS